MAEDWLAVFKSLTRPLKENVRDLDDVLRAHEDIRQRLVLMREATEHAIHSLYEQAKRKGARSEGTKTG